MNDADDAEIDRFIAAEDRKAQAIVRRFLDREQERVLAPALMLAVIDQAIKRLVTMGDPAEARALVEEMLTEAAARGGRRE
jgi:hypothetical protein